MLGKNKTKNPTNHHEKLFKHINSNGNSIHLKDQWDTTEDCVKYNLTAKLSEQEGEVTIHHQKTSKENIFSFT